MSTYVKSIYLPRIGLATQHEAVLKGQIIEVSDDIADILLSRTTYSEDLGKDVPLWEKSTAAAFKAQQPVVEEPAPVVNVAVPQQSQNTNETNEHQNEGGKGGSDDSEEEEEEETPPGGESDETPPPAPAAKPAARAKPATQRTKPATKPVTKPAAKK